MFTYANYATTAVHNETSCDAQAHNFYNTLELYWHASSYVHLLKVAFGVESACKIIYMCMLQQVPVTKSKHTVNKKLTICQVDKTV